MMNYQYTYTVLRYMHDVMTGKFINVGLVMHIPHQQRVLAKTQGNSNRIKYVFPNLDRNAFIASMQAIQRTLNAARFNVTRAKSSEGDALDFAKRAMPMDNSSLQWSPQGSGVTTNVQQTFERLYERFVTRYDAIADEIAATAEPVQIHGMNVITPTNVRAPTRNLQLFLDNPLPEILYLKRVAAAASGALQGTPMQAVWLAQREEANAQSVNFFVAFQNAYSQFTKAPDPQSLPSPIQDTALGVGT